MKERAVTTGFHAHEDASCSEGPTQIVRLHEHDPADNIGPKTFQYTNCIYREGEHTFFPRYDTVKKCVRSVTFDLSRYGEVSQNIRFVEKLVTEDYAIATAEAFLSKPLTEDYYNLVKEDLFDDALPFEEAVKIYNCRAACLTDATFLEIADFNDETGRLTLRCGS